MGEYFIFPKEDLEILRDGGLLYEYDDKVPNRRQEEEKRHIVLEDCSESVQESDTEE